MGIDVTLYNHCPQCGKYEEFYSDNITDNLIWMASEVGIYRAVWRPDKNGIEKAEQLIEPLSKGIADMENDPERFRALNPTNGFGSYEMFLPWLRRYLKACQENPSALVRVSR